MTYTKSTVQDFLATVPPFDQLSDSALSYLTERCQMLRYRMGQAVLVRDKMPAQVSILYQGHVRSLAYDPRTQRPVTLGILKPGAILGWIGLVRGVPCETAIASTETICLTLSEEDFFSLLQREPQVAAAFRMQAPMIEVFDLVGAELYRRANGDTNLKDFATEVLADAVVCNLPPGRTPVSQLEPDRLWLYSGGGKVNDLTVSDRLSMENAPAYLEVSGSQAARLVGVPLSLMDTIEDESAVVEDEAVAVDAEVMDIPYAPDRPPEGTSRYGDSKPQSGSQRFPHVKGRGQLEAYGLYADALSASQYALPQRRDSAGLQQSARAQRRYYPGSLWCRRGNDGATGAVGDCSG